MLDSMPAELANAAKRLVDAVRSYGSAAVAFSGGVDSTVVAKAAVLALDGQALAITGTSASLATGELEEARRLARLIGIRHEVIETAEFANPAYLKNDGTRCYFCKSTLYDQIEEIKGKFGFSVICSGANLDDMGDYRPGLKAAAERDVRHPLQEAGFTKERTRRLAQAWGLPNWDKPATPCLSSRLAIGVEVTPDRTRRVDAAERFLRERGFDVVRVRFHEGDHARIETSPESIALFADEGLRAAVTSEFKRLGFKFVSLDLEGFRSGGLNVLVPAELLAASGPNRS